jgi:hypothetical protein
MNTKKYEKYDETKFGRYMPRLMPNSEHYLGAM